MDEYIDVTQKVAEDVEEFTEVSHVVVLDVEENIDDTQNIVENVDEYTEVSQVVVDEVDKLNKV